MTNDASPRALLYSLLGDLPQRDRPVSATLISAEERDGMRIERLRLDLNGLEPVPALFIRPAAASGPFPTILYQHMHAGRYDRGKEELLAGHEFTPCRPWAAECAAHGWAALALDAWCFGERRGLSESETFKLTLWRGQVLWGLMVYDALRAIDYLHTRPDVAPARLATLGMSMGSTLAWWTAALDPRLRVCVDICCLTDFDALIAERRLDRHGLYYYVPGLLKHFSTAQINALIAPRAHLALAGERDPLTPAAGLERIDAALRSAYAAAGAPPGAWSLKRFPAAHEETPAMRAAALAFLDQWL